MSVALQVVTGTGSLSTTLQVVGTAVVTEVVTDTDSVSVAVVLEVEGRTVYVAVMQTEQKWRCWMGKVQYNNTHLCIWAPLMVWSARL